MFLAIIFKAIVNRNGFISFSTKLESQQNKTNSKDSSFAGKTILALYIVI
jgi:hypothetical protein